ncbi:hypothetical protein PIB30_085713, partial [Stylosanthes scabra]|nr:hypothetical protein [Stylosanthes scabra]
MIHPHQFTVSNLNISQLSNSGNIPSQPLSIPKGSINIVFLYINQKGREDTLLNDEDVECLNDEEVHECLKDVGVENEEEDVEDVDKEPKGMKSVHSISSGTSPSKLPSKLQFDW